MNVSQRLAHFAACAAIALALMACSKPTPPPKADILLFVGNGTSTGDVEAIKNVLRDLHLSWTAADSAQINAMEGKHWRDFRLLIVPGGNFESLGNSISPATARNIRSAVANGLNYLGICAGAFFAGNSPYNGLDLTDGMQFHFYALESKGIRKAVVPVSIAGAAAPIEQYWEDGPDLSGWGEVVARYPDRSAAVVQGHSGSGWIVLVGTHPEAPESWRRGMHFTSSARESLEFAATLVNSALSGTPLPHY